CGVNLAAMQLRMPPQKWRTPSIFIGSASETRTLLEDLSGILRRYKTPNGKRLVEVKHWAMDRTFRPGEFTLEALERAVDETDFAAFVLGREDRTRSRQKIQPSPRDNVIFEAGLFASRLGLSRTFFLVDGRGTKIPSDWAGLTYKTYDIGEKTP